MDRALSTLKEKTSIKKRKKERRTNDNTTIKKNDEIDEIHSEDLQEKKKDSDIYI
jgi:hypothetical protein